MSRREKVLKALSAGLKKAIAKADTDTKDYFAKVQGNKIWISDAEQFSRDVEKVMTDFFNKQKKDYIARIKNAAEDEIAAQSLEKDLEAILFSDENEYIKKLSKKMQPLIKQYIKDLAKKSVEDLAKTFQSKIKVEDPDWEKKKDDEEKPSYFDEKFFNKNSVEWIKNHVIKFSPEVQQTTHDAVVKSLIEGYKAGESMDELASRIDNLSEFNRTRAIRVARTETISASNAGEFEGYKQCDFVIGKQWLSAHDGRTRSDHAAANGQKRKVDEPFNVGGYKLMFPGDSSLGAPAKEVVHCRCTTVPIFEGESLDE